ncbi:MAG: Gfo/Idh/MocA family oxidoreductase [Acidimicrobiia bacterium]|nr:Gfo/Idh/MocA family oxidoreductase [Acidimicrobiia bacterium]
MSQEKIRLGITGSGFMGQTHAEAASQLEALQVVAVSGGSRAPAMAETYRLQVEPDARSLARREDVDAVVITTPHHIHVSEALEAAQCGKHLLIEKPMTTSVEDCDRILEAADRNGVKVAVGYHQRFRRNVAEACKLLRSGILGPILTVQISMPFPIAALRGERVLGSTWAWWNDPASLGHIINGGPHAIDVIRWCLQTEVATVSALCRTFCQDAPVENTTMALLSFTNGTLGTLFSTSVAASPNFTGEEFRFRIMGADGLMDLDPYGELRVATDGQWRTVSTQPPVGHQSAKTIFNPVRMESYQKQLRDFVRLIRGEPADIGSAVDGRAGVEACLAMLEASKKESVIRLR